MIGLVGGILGLLVGHLLGAAGSVYMSQLVGEGINWTAVGREEWRYLLAVVVLAGLAGLVPGLKAYRTPVATNLVAG
jgi:ABC-type antimicrobial peptide transport system permease subunit